VTAHTGSLLAIEAATTTWIATADPDFVDLARDEIRAADAGARVAEELAPGVLRIEGKISFGVLAEAWSTRPPIFVRHVSPIHTVVSLPGNGHDLGVLEEAVAAEIMPYLEPELRFSVQTRVFGDLPLKPFDVNQRVAAYVQDAAGPALDVRAPEQVVSVVCVAREEDRSRAYIGASLAAHNLSDWAGGMRRFAREEGQISRAEFKLLEALEAFHLDLPPRGVALDLGAAPGGWTRVLRSRGQYVTAVDPGDLDPRLAQDSGVRHRRMTAEAYLADEPDQFDVIVNDMRMDGRDSARLMVACAPLLYRHGWALMTLKLPEQRRAPVLDHAFAIVREAYAIVGARQLFHNRSEITVCLRRKMEV
jgi:23S rRNA (cytidine2498-2'-O)-methyltransferase